MTIKEQITQELEKLPEPILQEILNYVQFLQAKYNQQNQVEATNNTAITSTGASILKHLKTIGNWQGDDLQECLEEVISSRGQAKFNYELNPFD